MTSDTLQDTLDAMKYANQEKSEEEHRKVFLDHASSLVEYWHDLEDKSVREKLEGLLFSILVSIDGEACATPAYSLIPHVTVDNDKDDGTWEHSEEDIAGCLHDEYCRMRREEEEKTRSSGKRGISEAQLDSLVPGQKVNYGLYSNVEYVGQDSGNDGTSAHVSMQDSSGNINRVYRGLFLRHAELINE